MKTLFVHLEVWGRDFSPLAAAKEVSFDFDIAYEPGEVAQSGRFAGQPRPFGAASLTLHECDLEAPGTLAPLAEALSALRNCGAEELQVCCYLSYETQCNLEISPDFMKIMADNGVRLLISCYEDDEDFDDEA